ncbi:UPF0553 protein C9orf64-like protein [Syncephalis pseudoplumigaleata]|uniref:Queuosine 5'-phosphate N-glycosylase/hydrolase n=1 Tax=Syncephalis pseudoplumigaleata TaxID=1712513 RepID=A0A4P9YUQ0_9FUNG|nr:UPF0553 protein C9orf64-like protein [Syncephalis pseudoplumigaleata]|eukprot:RKP23574.1 UPF0553 protein C9orf64-like protein [Syncephalis pseudoplumigaleata]
MPLNPVLESAHFIAEHSKDVSIDMNAVEKVATMLFRQMEKTPYTTQVWRQHPLNPSHPTEATIDWIFVVDLLNFSFWSDAGEFSPDRYTVVYNGQSYTGYWALCACINRAIDEGLPMTQASFYANATDEQLSAIFRSDTSEQIPLLAERIRLLREAGQVLIKQYNGSFVHCVKAARKQAAHLLDLIVRSFAVFRDECQFAGRPVQFYKRAQILIADIWACFDGEGLGEFVDIDHVTMFADYRVPQSLAYLGLLQYSADLHAHLEADRPLDYGSRLEVEIRGNSIWAVEQLRQCMLVARSQSASSSSSLPPINAILLDFYLWDFAKDNAQALCNVPVHRTRSIFY